MVLSSQPCNRVKLLFIILLAWNACQNWETNLITKSEINLEKLP